MNQVTFIALLIGVTGQVSCNPVCSDATVREVLAALGDRKLHRAVSESSREMFEQERPKLSPSFKLWGREPGSHTHRVWYSNGATYAIELQCHWTGTDDAGSFHPKAFPTP